MDQELREAVEMAMKMEQDGLDYYLEAAAKCPSESARHMFESFAADEKRHLEWVGRMAQGLGVDMTQTSMPLQSLRSVFDKVRGQLDETAASTQDEKDAVAFALKMEAAGYKNYVAAAALATAPDAQAIFERLAAEESQHYQMLENTLEYMNATAEWFLYSEGGLLSGDMSSLG
jgi:rubrerythrin